MGQPEIDQYLSSRKFEKTELRTVLFSFFFFIFNSTRINDRRKGKEGGNEWRQEWNNREKRMEPLFSYFNIRDFSLRFLHSCGQSRGGVERSKKRTASTVFLWRFLSGRREISERTFRAMIGFRVLQVYKLLILISRIN